MGELDKKEPGDSNDNQDYAQTFEPSRLSGYRPKQT